LSFDDCPNFDGDETWSGMLHETFLQHTCIFFTNASRRYRLPGRFFAPDTLPNITRRGLQTCPPDGANLMRWTVLHICLSPIFKGACDDNAAYLNSPVSKLAQCSQIAWSRNESQNDCLFERWLIRKKSKGHFQINHGAERDHHVGSHQKKIRSDSNWQ
jgi:hypothetical protein